MEDVVVVGAGAMGVFLSVRMSRIKGQKVYLLARPGRAHALQEHGVRLEPLEGLEGPQGGQVQVLEGGKNLAIVTEAKQLPSPSIVFFAVRAYQTKEAAEKLAEAGVDPAGVVTLQNGLGNAEALTQVFSPEQVAAGATSHGVLFEPPGRFVHTGWGKTSLGPWVEKAGQVARQAAKILEEAGLPVDRVHDPRPVLWRKVAVNAAINPATAIYRVENGKLLEGGLWEQELREAAREVARVAQAEGIDLPEDEAEEQAVEVARMTARNRSSMLQALEAGRPLELDAITGEVVDRAHRHEIPVPVNEAHRKRLADLAPPKEKSTG